MFAVVCGILTVVSLVYWFVASATDVDYFNYGKKEKERRLKRASKLLWIFISLSIFGALGRVFTPTTSEALVIFGVGESVEYLQNNKDATQIPDKALQALNKYLDGVIDDKNHTDNEE